MIGIAGYFLQIQVEMPQPPRGDSAQHCPPQSESGVVAQDAQVAVDAGLEAGALVRGGFARFCEPIEAPHRSGEVALGPVGDGDSARFDDDVEVLHAPPRRLQVDLAGMEGEPKFPVKVFSDDGYSRFKPTVVSMHDYKVINISAAETKDRLFYKRSVTIRQDVEDYLLRGILIRENLRRRVESFVILAGADDHLFFGGEAKPSSK